MSLLTGLLRTPGYHSTLPSFPLLEVRVVHRSNGGSRRSAVANRSRQEAGRSERSGPASPKPLIGQRGPELQAFGTISPLPNGLDQTKLKPLSRSSTSSRRHHELRDLYKKHHWQVAGPTFYQLHLLFDKHYDEQVELVDMIAERIQLLGGIASRWPQTWRRRPASRGRRAGAKKCRYRSPGCWKRTSSILKHAHEAAGGRRCGRRRHQRPVGQQCIRTNELQVWFLAEHLVDVPVVEADEE